MNVESFTRSLIIGAFVAGAGAAQAADYIQPPPPPPPPPTIIVQPPQEEEFASGWYLRGDIGMSNQSVGSLSNDNYSRYGSVQNVDKGFDAAPFVGIGIGYNVNDWLRVDATGEWRGNANFHGMDRGYDTGLGTWIDDNYSASKSELTFLLNGYVDLGTWSHFTPFVGAGIGMSRNTISNFRDLSTKYQASASSDAASKWSMAWALYAGLGYKVNKNVTLEFAYRYLNLGDATTGTMVGYTGNTDTPFEFHHLTSQDFKLGVRVNFDAFESAPERYYAPAPVYAPPPVYQPAPVYQPPLSSRG